MTPAWAVSGRTVALLTLATIPVWIVVFVWTPLNFWFVMALGTGGLALTAAAVAPRAMAERFRFRPADVVIGLASAAVLYGIFVVGRAVATWMLPFAPDQIGAVYDNKALLAPGMIGVLIGLIIGPGEEIFWRGFLQRELQPRHGRWAGYLAATAVYGLVHIFTGNFMLVVAASVAGLVWGFLYLHYGRLWPGIISHVAWDLAVFLFFPLA